MALDELCDLFSELSINQTPTNNPKEFISKFRQECVYNSKNIEKIIKKLTELYEKKFPELNLVERKRKTLQNITELGLYVDNINSVDVLIALGIQTSQENINKICFTLLQDPQYYGPVTNAISQYCGNLRGLELGMYIFNDLLQEQPRYLQ